MQATTTNSALNKPTVNKMDETNNAKSDTSESGSGGAQGSVDDSTILDLLDISTDEPRETDCLLDIFSNAANGCKPIASAQSTSTTSNILTFDFLKKIHSSTGTSDTSKKVANNKTKTSDKKTSAWMDLFADLDPLANPTTMEKKISGMNQNCLDA